MPHVPLRMRIIVSYAIVYVTSNSPEKGSAYFILHKSDSVQYNQEPSRAQAMLFWGFDGVSNIAEP